MHSRYLYEMATGADSTFRNLMLNDSEIKFLKNFQIEFTAVDNYYIVNCDELKELFCNC